MKLSKLLLLITFFSIFNVIRSQEIYFFNENGYSLGNKKIIIEGVKTDTLFSSKSGRVNIDNFDKLRYIGINKGNNVYLYFSKKEIIDANFKLKIDGLSYTVPGINGYSLPAFETKTKRKSHIPFGLQNIFHEVIKENDIINSNASTGAELLLLSSGVTIQKSQLGGGSPILRGVEANRILLVLDGVRMNNAIYRSGHLQNSLTVDPLIVSSCDVIYGPGAVTYGSDAIGGVVHYKTKNPKLSPSDSALWKINYFSRYNSASQEISNHFDVNYGKKNWAILNSFTYKKYENQKMGKNRSHGYNDWGLHLFRVDRINNNDTVLMNNDPSIQKGLGYSQFDFLQKIILQAGSNLSIKINNQISTSTEIARFDQLNNLNSSGLPEFSQWNYGPQKRLLSSLDFAFTKSNLLFDEFNIIASYQNIKESRITRLFQSPIQEERVENVNIYGISLDAVKNLTPSFKIFYGLESYQNIVKSTGLSNDISTGESFSIQTRYPNGGGLQNLSGIYSTLAFKGHSFSLLGGFRYAFNFLSAQFNNTLNSIPLPFNQISNNTNALNGNLNLNYYPNANTQLNLDISTGFRAPNIDDFGKVFKKDQHIMVPNNSLEAEYAYNGALSVYQNVFSKHKGFNLSLNGSFFTTLLNNVISRTDYQINGLDSIFYNGQMCRVRTNTNFDKAFIYGFNSSMKVTFLKSWELFTCLTYTKGSLINESEPLSHIPPIFGRTSLKFISKKGVSSFFMRYNGWKKIEDFGGGNVDNPMEATQDGTPSWITYNVQFDFPINNKLKTSLGCYNITDIHYKTFSSAISSPGRSWLISLNLVL